jgi:hypothetical protein
MPIIYAYTWATASIHDVVYERFVCMCGKGLEKVGAWNICEGVPEAESNVARGWSEEGDHTLVSICGYSWLYLELSIMW